MNLRVTAGHQGDGLVKNVEDRVELLAPPQWRTDVDHNHQVDAHLAGHVHRDVVDHAAIDQQLAVDFHRSKHRRDRHAGANHLGQVAFAEHHFLATDDVGGHGAERDGQFVEVAHVTAVRQQAFQQQCQVLPLNDAQWQAQATIVTEAEFLSDQKVPVILLAPERDILAGGAV